MLDFDGASITDVLVNNQSVELEREANHLIVPGELLGDGLNGVRANFTSAVAPTGTPLTVYRKGFRARDSVLGADVRIPDRPVASLMVVRAAEEASVAVVRATHEELAMGDYFRGDAR